MTISAAIERFDLEMYIQNFGATALTKPGEWVLDCPACGKEDKVHVNTNKKFWHCWVCEQYRIRFDGRRVPVVGAGGVLALIQLLEGCSKERAVSIVLSQIPTADAFDLDALEADSDDPDYLSDQQTDIQPARAISPPEYWQPITDVGYGILTYLARRGITKLDVRQYGLVYCQAGRYANRLIFPVWERRRLVYFQARAMWEAQGRRFLKTLNPPNVEGAASATEVLFNLDTARQYPRVAITEGPIDAIRVGPDAVATFGKKISMIQILKMKYAGVRAIDLMWDGPSKTEPYGAWPEMLQAASKLAGMFNDVRLVFLPEGDPGDYEPAQNAKFRAEAKPASSISRLAVL